MYLPKHFAENEPATLHRFMREFPLATVIVQSPDGLLANHLPLLLDSASTTLRGHVARANPLWQLPAESDVLAIFHGPQAYITPDWYPGKAEHGKAVPTWNYVVVHAHGRLRVIDDRVWLHELVSAQTASQESGRAHPWKVTDAPAAYIDTMLGAVVGIEIVIERLVGKSKISQNQTPANAQGVANGLRRETGNAVMADLVADAAKARTGKA